MKRKVTRNDIRPELSDDDKFHIMELFFEEIAPKLAILHARVGNFNCEFAGREYQNWNIHFHSRGSGFEIVEIYYDEEGGGLDLDL